jgi:predicted transcriptional regulator
MTQGIPGCAPALSPAQRAGKPALADRPLITAAQAGGLVVFKVLGNDTRLRLLHALHRDGEVPVGELAEQVQMRPQAVSNQLQRLANRGIVSTRRDGNHRKIGVTSREELITRLCR